MQYCTGLRTFHPVILFHDKPINCTRGMECKCPINDESVEDKKRAVDDMMNQNSQYWRERNLHESLYNRRQVLPSSLTNSIYSRQDQSMDGNHVVKQKRRRGNLPKATTARLKEWLSAHRKHPYPTEDQKISLAKETMLSLQQISNWFINARRRHLPLLLGINPQRNAGNVYAYGSSDTSEDSTSDNGKRIRCHPRSCLRKSGMINKPYRRNKRRC